MTTLYSFQKPYKVWSCDRILRKSVVASSLLELQLKGAEKLSYENSNISELRVVLEHDGTEIEDDSYFQTAEQDTIFLLLRASEKWLPPGVDALKAAINAIPGIVCDALNKMELVDKVASSWKIMDDKGNVTVVLNWDHCELDRANLSATRARGSGDWTVEVDSVDGQTSTAATAFATQHIDQKGALSCGRTSTSPTPALSSSTCSPSPNSAARAKLKLEGLTPRVPQRAMSNQRVVSFVSTSHHLTRNGELKNNEFDSDEDEDDDDEKTEHESSPTHDHSQCDFHCSALHRNGAHIKVQVTKSVATSPIQETIIVPVLSVSSDSHYASGSSTLPKKGAKYVRFSDLEAKVVTNGSDSETENTEQEDTLSEKYLLLVDQLTIDQDKHLTVKDIGTILERLSSKIVDIDKLERERETADCYNWVIKATIKGEVLREFGVIYNGQYYGIMEHPGYF